VCVCVCVWSSLFSHLLNRAHAPRGLHVEDDFKGSSAVRAWYCGYCQQPFNHSAATATAIFSGVFERNRYTDVQVDSSAHIIMQKSATSGEEPSLQPGNLTNRKP
jgi:hypothetical protein